MCRINAGPKRKGGRLDSRAFDQLTKRLGMTGTRRNAMRMAVVLGAAGLGGQALTAHGETVAPAGNKCKGKRCNSNKNCGKGLFCNSSGTCQYKHGNKGKKGNTCCGNNDCKNGLQCKNNTCKNK